MQLPSSYKKHNQLAIAEKSHGACSCNADQIHLSLVLQLLLALLNEIEREVEALTRDNSGLCGGRTLCTGVPKF